MSTPASVLVVGASAAGLSTAEALRRNGYAGSLTVLGAEPHPPYDRPPLSKQVLAGAWQPERAHLRPPAMLAAVDAEFVLGDPAVALDAPTRTVRTAAGRSLTADAVVLATGLAPRTLPGQDGLAGVHVLRTLDDALALRAELATASTVVVVGEGVLAAEIAATTRKLGLAVTMAGPQPAPLAAQLGPFAGDLLAALHAENGVTLRLGTAVTGLIADVADGVGRVTGVRLSTGEALPADLVVVAIGAAPVTGWLADSGLTVDNGVLCDARCHAGYGVWAVGDVARWHREDLGASVRLENRTNATEQAGVVAANILGADRAYRPVPYMWTDQYDAKLQVFGMPSPDDEVRVVDGAVADRRFVALYRRAGVVTGVLGWNMPKQTRLRRQELIDAAPIPAV